MRRLLSLLALANDREARAAAIVAYALRDLSRAEAGRVLQTAFWRYVSPVFPVSAESLNAMTERAN